MDEVTILHGDSLVVLPTLAENTVDSIVTDPPYGIRFMSRKWDYNLPNPAIWGECLRVLKPGGFLLSFGGCRTYHRLVCNIEDAGFVIHPLIAWIFAQGFPKATNLGKAIDKAAGAEREVVGKHSAPCRNINATPSLGGSFQESPNITAPATDAAKQWDGWFYGLQALKPAIEPICMAQKPYDGKPVDSVLKWGVGAINVDECRIATVDEPNPSITRRETARRTGNTPTFHGDQEARKKMEANGQICSQQSPESFAAEHPGEQLGRWPANVILQHDARCVRVGVDKVLGEDHRPRPTHGYADADGLETVEDWECHPDCPVGMFPGSDDGPRHALPKTRKRQSAFGHTSGDGPIGDSGSAARFFYCSKASGSDRGNLPSEELPLFGETVPEFRNTHPTVKPTDLMVYLCRLITPPNGMILDPFMGSGTTGVAAKREGFRFIGIELSQDSIDIARARLGK